MADERRRLVGTGEAARAVGLSPRSLARYAQQGSIKPALVTPGNRLKWDIDDLRRQFEELRKRD